MNDKIKDLQMWMQPGTTTTWSDGLSVTASVTSAVAPNPNGMVGIKGVLVIEGELTGDNRFIDPGAVVWEDGPWSLMGQVVNDGHSGAPIVGRIDSLARMDNRILFEGVIDCNIAEGAEVARLIGNQLLRGISLDGDMGVRELRTPDGRNLEDLTESELEALDWGSVVSVASSLRVRGGTMLAMPAFVDTELELFECGAEVASGFVAKADSLPPMWWFENPGLQEPTPITITPEGRIFGHIVEDWNQCHISVSGMCMKPPHSKSDYAFYKRGGVATWCDSCQREEVMATGPITATTGHAELEWSKDKTISHYDNSGSRVADVVVGEDKFGIWMTGRIAPTASKEQVDSLLALGVSGDWRRQNGNLELVAILSVPVPGYPIRRKSMGHVASGVQTSLITAPYKPRGYEALTDVQSDLTSLKKVTVGLLREKIKP